MTIDAHHHFWVFDEREYDWIRPEQIALRQNFLPADLERELRSAGVDGAISVEARQSLEETSSLLAFAQQHQFIRGVVGWVPLVAADVGAILAGLATQPKFCGVRHVLQGEADAYFSRDDFHAGLAQLARFHLAYDLLVVERQLPAAIALVDRHPSQVFILDHIAKPKIAAGIREPWARNLRELARRPNVYCKISGMVTEADRVHWSERQLRPYFDVALESFGPRRLMFGSDWPVCLDAATYRQWHGIVTNWIAPLSTDEQARILGATAVEAYRLRA